MSQDIICFISRKKCQALWNEWVFVFGEPAGGHLTGAVALAMSTGDYVEWFGDDLTIKGLTPFYPANIKVSHNGGMLLAGGSKEPMNPIYLVDADRPPCLNRQGTRDLWQVHNKKAYQKKYLDEGNEKCGFI